MNEQEIKKPTLKIFLVKDDIRLGDVVRMWSLVSSSDQQEKPEEDAKPINVEKLIEQELDRLSDEDNRGEWDASPLLISITSLHNGHIITPRTYQ